jgi:hypothetical protein
MHTCRVRESIGKQISSLNTTASSAYKTRMQRSDWKSMYYMKEHVDMDKRGIDSPGMFVCVYTWRMYENACGHG